MWHEPCKLNTRSICRFPCKQNGHVLKKSAFDNWIVRPKAKEWAPFVGNYYAGLIGDAWFWRMLRLPTALVLLVPINVLPLFGSWAADIADIVIVLIFVVMLFALPAATKVKLKAVAAKMGEGLRRAGRAVESSPDLVSVDRFLEWSSGANMTMEDVVSSAPPVTHS
jgi:hypothetical protein